MLTAPVFASNTTVVAYFFGKELWDSGAGLVAAALIAICPGYISRSVAGSLAGHLDTCIWSLLGVAMYLSFIYSPVCVGAVDYWKVLDETVCCLQLYVYSWNDAGNANQIPVRGTYGFYGGVISDSGVLLVRLGLNDSKLFQAFLRVGVGAVALGYISMDRPVLDPTYAKDHVPIIAL